MFLTFDFEVNRFRFRCFVCNFQAVGPRIVNFGIDVPVEEVSSVVDRVGRQCSSPLLRSNL